MSQFIEQLGNDLAALKLKSLDPEDRQFLFEAFADFFMSNAGYLKDKGSGPRYAINVQIIRKETS